MLTEKCPPNSKSFFLFFGLKKKKSKIALSLRSQIKKQKKKQNEPLLIPASSLWSRSRCCCERQPSSCPGAGGDWPDPSWSSPQARGAREGQGFGQAGAAGQPCQWSGAQLQGVDGTLSFQRGIPVCGGELFWKIQFWKRKKKKKKNTWQCRFLAYPLQGLKCAGCSARWEGGSQPVTWLL